MNTTTYWDERAVLIHALCGGYTELEADEVVEAINALLNTPQLLYGSLECLLELEAGKLITTELLDIEYINQNFLPRTILRQNKLTTVNKPYTTLKELASDSGFGLGTLEKLIEGRGLKIKVTVNDSRAIRRKLISYLANFTSGNLTTGTPTELWSYGKQKAYVLWRIQNEIKDFGNPMNLRLYEVPATIRHTSRLFTTLFALVFEKIVGVQNIKIDKEAKVAYPQLPVYIRVHLNRNPSDLAKIIEPFETEFAKAVEVSEPEGTLRIGNLTLDDNSVRCKGKELQLTPKELTVLVSLMTEYPRTVRNKDLRNIYFDEEYESGKLDDKQAADLMPSIYTAIKNLRKILEQNDAQVQIKTKSKIGYNLTKI